MLYLINIVIWLGSIELVRLVVADYPDRTFLHDTAIGFSLITFIGIIYGLWASAQTHVFSIMFPVLAGVLILLLTLERVLGMILQIPSDLAEPVAIIFMYGAYGFMLTGLVVLLAALWEVRND